MTSDASTPHASTPDASTPQASTPDACTVRVVAPTVIECRYPCATLPPFDTCASTLIVDEGDATVVDPGWSDRAVGRRVVEIARSAGARRISRILLTHTHRDHVAGLDHLLQSIGPVPVHVHPSERHRIDGGDAIDLVDTQEGDAIVVGASRWVTWHVPGHAPGHLAWFGPDRPDGERSGTGRGLIAGDLVTGRGAAWIGTPYGDATAYLGSLRRARAAAPTWMTFAHGAPTDDPSALLTTAIDHRERRARAIVEAIARGVDTVDDLLAVVHGSTDEAVRPWALASVEASIDAAVNEGTVRRSPTGTLAMTEPDPPVRSSDAR